MRTQGKVYNIDGDTPTWVFTARSDARVNVETFVVKPTGYHA